MPSPSQDLRGQFFPAPTGGLNLRDALWDMPENDARVMDNAFPETDSVRAKGGVTELANISTPLFGTLAPFSTSAGAPYLISISHNGVDIDINSIDVSNGTVTDITGALGLLATQWQYEMHMGRIFFFSGSSNPFDWTGSGNVTATAWTGSGLTIGQLIQAISYKGRLFIVEYPTCNVWHSTLSAVTGALTKKDYKDQFRRGGIIAYVATSAYQGSSIDDDVFVIASSEGEVLVYAGDFPDSPTWRIIGRYYIPRPVVLAGSVPNRGYTYVGKELHLITVEGPIPLSAIMSKVDLDNPFIVPAGKVRKAFLEASTSRGTWEGHYSPEKNYLLINVPNAAYTTIVQYVMNTITKAWCRFTGWEAYSWAYIAGKLYFATITGEIYEADVPFEVGPSGSTAVDIRQAYTTLGALNSEKVIGTVEPIFTAENDTGSNGTNDYGLAFDVDFADATETFTKSMNVGGSSATLNKELHDVVVSGQFIGPRFSATFTTGTDLRLFGMNIYAKVGGL